MSALLCRMYTLGFILRKKKHDQVPQICISKLHSTIVTNIHIRCSQKMTSMHLYIALATGFYS